MVLGIIVAGALGGIIGGSVDFTGIQDILQPDLDFYVLARDMAILAENVYDPSKKIMRTPSTEYKVTVKIINDNDYGYVAESSSHRVVVFRGSDDREDWVGEDGNFSEKTQSIALADRNIEVHEGILSAFLKFKDDKELFTEMVKKDGKQLVIVGHSRGGGIASLMAIYLINEPVVKRVNPEVDPIVFTFGEPRSLKTPEDFGIKKYRFINRNDLVPLNPPNLYHWGEVYRINVGPDHNYMIEEHGTDPNYPTDSDYKMIAKLSWSTRSVHFSTSKSLIDHFAENYIIGLEGYINKRS
jgi:hypothetical protein